MAFLGCKFPLLVLIASVDGSTKKKMHFLIRIRSVYSEKITVISLPIKISSGFIMNTGCDILICLEYNVLVRNLDVKELFQFYGIEQGCGNVGLFLEKTRVIAIFCSLYL
jgi:hypothetical protein